MICSDLEVVLHGDCFKKGVNFFMPDSDHLPASLTNQMMVHLSADRLIDCGTCAHIRDRDLASFCQPLKRTG